MEVVVVVVVVALVVSEEVVELPVVVEDELPPEPLSSPQAMVVSDTPMSPHAPADAQSFLMKTPLLEKSR